MNIEVTVHDTYFSITEGVCKLIIYTHGLQIYLMIRYTLILLAKLLRCWSCYRRNFVFVDRIYKQQLGIVVSGWPEYVVKTKYTTN